VETCDNAPMVFLTTSPISLNLTLAYKNSHIKVKKIIEIAYQIIGDKVINSRDLAIFYV
jgi:hypothetical protein